MKQTSSSAIQTEKDGKIGWIILSRPEQLNAINDDIRLNFPQAIAEMEKDPDIRVIVIRGAGHRSFCVGADIKETRPPETAIEVRQRMENSRWIESIDEVSKPVIAAIHGFCLGGGMELALACDIRIAAPDASFALPEVALGLIPGGGGTQRIVKLIGLSRSLDILLCGERFSAQQAHNIGLVTRLSTSSDSLVEEARTLAEGLTRKSPLALAYAKKAARTAINTSLKEGLNTELDLFALLAVTEDRKEAALAFTKKRLPNFTGK